MKDKFVKLVEEIDGIRTQAHEVHVRGFFESDFVLYDVPEFLIWKQAVSFELNAIKKDDFISNTISILEKFDGYSDRRHFDELAGALKAICENIDYYYGAENKNMGLEEKKSKMIFISHSTADKKYIKPFVELLEDLGLNEEEIICSSIPPYCIPLDGKVYQWLVERFQCCELHVFFMLSHNYYESAASLNEMGAAWAMKQKWTGILLPGFDFRDIKGCIDNTQISIKLDDSDVDTLNYRLEELKNNLTTEFQLRNMSPTVWERKRVDFLRKIESAQAEEEREQTPENNIVLDKAVSPEVKKSINVDSCVLLAYAAESAGGQIIVSSDLEGKTIETSNVVFTKSKEKKVVARWVAALSELVNQGYVKVINANIYEVTYSGYNFAEQIKDGLKIDVSHDFEEYLVD